ncbi:MAG: hypothetical protein KAR07_07395 [Spirochaetes bacterium]|nr:hypothetical protein [Spirochaetota bacterium]
MKKYTSKMLLFMIIITLMSAFFMLSCGLESFNSYDALNSPLGLTVSSSNKNLYLQFTAVNAEEFFNGFNVFVGKDETEVRDQKYILLNESGMLPFKSYTPFTNIQVINIVVTKNTDGNNFPVGLTNYIGVTAYDSQNKTNSRTSNVELFVIIE